MNILKPLFFEILVTIEASIYLILILHYLKRITWISCVRGGSSGSSVLPTGHFALRHVDHMWIHLEQLWEIESINVDCLLINIILMCHFFICVILRFLKPLLKLSILI